MKLEEKMKAIQMRKKGITYSVIRKELNVSKSTLSLWLRDIDLNQYQRNKILVGLEKSRAAAVKQKVADRLKRTNNSYSRATKEFPFLLRKPLFLTGLALYWAEGDKAQERVKFANSDPRLIALMMKWFREICLVPEERFRIALHIHNLHCNGDVMSHWKGITKIPFSQFNKVYVKKTSLGYRKNALYNGTCSVIINSKDLFRRITSWKANLFEYFMK